MKRIIYLFLTSWLLMGGLSLNLYAQEPQNDFFYHYQNQQIPLEVCTEKVLVKFSTSLHPAEQRGILSRYEGLMGEWAKPLADATVIPLNRGMSQSAILELLEQLSKNPGIDFAHPFFWIDGAEHPLSYRDDFIVKLREGYSQQQLEAKG